MVVKCDLCYTLVYISLPSLRSLFLSVNTEMLRSMQPTDIIQAPISLFPDVLFRLLFQVLFSYNHCRKIKYISFWPSCLGPLVFKFPNILNYFALQYLDLGVPDEGYFRNASCVLIYIFTFLLVCIL